MDASMDNDNKSSDSVRVSKVDYDSSTISPFGEIVEASTTHLLAQCHRLYTAPSLGDLVCTEEDNTAFSVVADVSTKSIDPSRRPLAMSQGQDTVDDIYNRHPQISRLLSTEISLIVVAHKIDGQLFRYLSPVPPKIHAQVSICKLEDVRALTMSLEFLSVLVTSSVGSPDDVIAAFLRIASVSHPDPKRFLVDAGKNIATLLAGDVHRLNALLRRIS